MLRTFLAAAATLSAIAGASFALQAGAFGRLDRGRLEVVQILGRLVESDRSRATFVLAGKRHTAVCHDRGRSNEGVAAVVVVDGSHVVIKADGQVRPDTLLAASEFFLAGCPRPLRDWLGAALARSATIQAIPAMIHGHAVDQIRVLRAKTPLELFAAHAGGVPLRLALFARRIQGVSTVHFGAIR